MLWIVEYDNGYFYNDNDELVPDVCRRYFKKEENAVKFYNETEKRLIQTREKGFEGFENISYYYEYFSD